jgi:DNA-binding response OmpR family regulator
MPSRVVVVVEDDDRIAELLALYLGQAGFRVERARDGHAGLAHAADHGPALVVVDIGLPGSIDGLEVCRRLRAAGDVPIVVLTARGDEADRIRDFELGADDYVTKPFSPRELVARVEAILRRTGGGAPATVVSLGDVEVDLARHEVRRGGEVVPLAPREFALLATLAEHRGLVLSRRQLLDQAWGYDFYGDERTVDVHVRQLRRKLGEASPIVTVWGVGYKVAPAKEAATA